MSGIFITPTLRYIWLTLQHKYFVLGAGLKFKVPIWQLLIHDMSKFNITKETIHYGKQFFGTKDDPLGFSYAWNHHQKKNKHHWEYWIPLTGHNRGGYSDLQPLPMPEKYIREMLADWMGAGRAYEGVYPKKGNWPWFTNTFPKISQRLHPDTKKRILELIEIHLK